MNPRVLALTLILSVLAGRSLSAAELAALKHARPGPFILGAEVSWAPEDEADGAEYFDHGIKKDIFQILSDYHFNYIRLRLFVNPGATNGYAAGKKEAFCDLTHVIGLAQRARARQMGLLVDIHYGDTWTSPGHQDWPGAWRGLPFATLTNTIHAYTREVIKQMKVAGVTPNMVQVGNEISNGVLYPDGRRSNFDKFAAFIQAGIAGIREVDPQIKIVLHHHLGRNNAVMREWLDNFIRRGTDFDLIGMSCYAQAAEGDWQNNFNDLARRYPDKGLLVVEYSGRKRQLNDLMFNAPDKKGWGGFIWEPTRHKEALFNRHGHNAGGGAGATLKNQETNAPAVTVPEPQAHGGRYDVNELMDLYPVMARDYASE